MSRDLRRALIATARAMNASGINLGTSGNVSARCGADVLITPTGLDYERLDPDDIVRLSPEGRFTGARRPSSEWRFHLAIYAGRPEVGAVVHAHPTHATALACLHRDLPAVHYEVALAGGADIRCAPYATFGTAELAANVVAALESRRACLIANHGLVALGAGLDEALGLARRVEQLAAIYLACLAAGEPRLLDSQEMRRVAERLRNYGQRQGSD